MSLDKTQEKQEGRPLQPQLAKACFAAGCFWGVQQIVRGLEGVVRTAVGYTGGIVPNPTYQDICTGSTGHAEAVLLDYDELRLEYSALLEYFFRLHDPTTLNQQGNDRGTQYRSAIFYFDEAQREAALEAISVQNKSGYWARPVVTTVEPASLFYFAEDYHQDYLLKYPEGYNCHFLRAR